MGHELLSNSQVGNLETFYASSEGAPCLPDDDLIATQLVNVRMPNCDSAGGDQGDKIAEMSVNFCMPKACMAEDDEKFARKLEMIVEVDGRQNIIKPDGKSSELQLSKCIEKLKALVPNNDITFLGGKIMATCKGDTTCEKCVEVMGGTVAESAGSEMYGDFGSNTYDNAVI